MVEAAGHHCLEVLASPGGELTADLDVARAWAFDLAAARLAGEIPMAAVSPRNCEDHLVPATLVLAPRRPSELIVATPRLARSFGRAVKRGFGQPFNGQQRRIDVILTLLQHYQADVMVETGTFLGSTTEWMARRGMPVFTCETAPNHFVIAYLRLLRRRNVVIAHGDSRLLLGHLAASATQYERPFFYLDAHWGEDLPLRDELDIIWSNWDDSLVVVDDFYVDHDHGYEYDDYGPGRRLDMTYVSPPPEVASYLPAAHSSSETGPKRGTAYLGRGEAGKQALQLAADCGTVIPEPGHP